jgi:hypothetical protein
MLRHQYLPSQGHAQISPDIQFIPKFTIVHVSVWDLPDMTGLMYFSRTYCSHVSKNSRLFSAHSFRRGCASSLAAKIYLLK